MSGYFYERASQLLYLLQKLSCFCSAIAVQHDVHELNRILFDAIEDSLKGTAQERLIEQLYKGISVNQAGNSYQPTSRYILL